MWRGCARADCAWLVRAREVCRRESTRGPASEVCVCVRRRACAGARKRSASSGHTGTFKGKAALSSAFVANENVHQIREHGGMGTQCTVQPGGQQPQPKRQWRLHVVVVVAATAQTLWKFRGGFRTGSGLQPSFLEVPTRLLFRTTTGFLCPLPSHVPPSVVKTSEQPGPNSWTQSLFKTRAHWAGGRVSTFRAVEGVT